MKYAITTIILFNNKYVPAAAVLGHTLKEKRPANSSVDLILMIAEFPGFEKEIEILQQFWDRIDVVPVLSYPTSYDMFGSKVIDHYSPWADKVYSKAHMFDLKNASGELYERVILLDADMFVVEWPEKLFSIQTPALWVDLTNNNRYTPKHAIKADYDANRVTGTRIPNKMIRDCYDPNLHNMRNRTYIPGLPVAVIDKGQGSVAEFDAFMKKKTAKGPYGVDFIVNAPDEQAICDYLTSKSYDIYHCGAEHAALLWHKNMKFENCDQPIIIHMIGQKKPCFLPLKVFTAAERAEVMKYPDTPMWLEHWAKIKWF